MRRTTVVASTSVAVAGGAVCFGLKSFLAVSLTAVNRVLDLGAAADGADAFAPAWAAGFSLAVMFLGLTAGTGFFFMTAFLELLTGGFDVNA